MIAEEGPNRVLSVAINPANTLIAYGVEVLGENSQTLRGTVKIYDIAEQRVTKQLSGHKSGISELKFSPDGLLLARFGPRGTGPDALIRVFRAVELLDPRSGGRSTVTTVSGDVAWLIVRGGSVE